MARQWRGNLLTFSRIRRRIQYRVSTETNILIQRAAAKLKTADAREFYVFGSAAKGTGDAASDALIEAGHVDCTEALAS